MLKAFVCKSRAYLNAMLFAAAIVAAPQAKAMGKHTPGNNSTLSGKKVIYLGIDPLTTPLVRDHWQEIKALPFDGYAMPLCPNGLASCWFKMDPFNPGAPLHRSDFDSEMRNLSGIFPQTEKEIFIPLNLNNPGLSLYDDASWARIADNFEVIAGLATELGAKGFFLDPEGNPGTSAFGYTYASSKIDKSRFSAPRSFNEYRTQAFLRGQQIMLRIQSKMTNSQLLSFWGYSTALQRGAQWWDTETARKNKFFNNWAHDYTLLPAFFDGMVSVMKGKEVLIDGYEKSYNYVHKQDFEKGRNEMEHRSEQLSLLSSAVFHSRARVGFGLALDYGNTFGNPWGKRNFWSTQAFEGSVRSALSNSDEYVWIWSESAHFFNQSMHGEDMRKNVPDSYIQAIRKAKASY